MRWTDGRTDRRDGQGRQTDGMDERTNIWDKPVGMMGQMGQMDRTDRIDVYCNDL